MEACQCNDCNVLLNQPHCKRMTSRQARWNWAFSPPQENLRITFLQVVVRLGGFDTV